MLLDRKKIKKILLLLLPKVLFIKVFMIIIKIKGMLDMTIIFQLMIFIMKICVMMKLIMKTKKVACTMKAILISKLIIVMIVIIVKLNYLSFEFLS